MRIGAVFPQLEIGNDPAEIAHWVQGVEELARVRTAATAAGRPVTDVGIEPRLVLAEHLAALYRPDLVAFGWS